ncbi:retrotransposon hot spot (RHS) protein [Trypanosoma cruzi]|nr:retrotransposon hot spot (RHS) protein [Trypanosoma cruzi]
MILGVLHMLRKERIFTLRQWREFKRRDAVIPLARAQINNAFSQVLRGKRREAEEMARRERQEPGIDVSTRIKYAVFEGRFRVDEMKLNDFFAMELDGRGRCEHQSECLAGGVFKDPENYIGDAGVLGEIQTTYRYKRMERAVRDEMDMEEGVDKLYDNGVDNLM